MNEIGINQIDVAQLNQRLEANRSLYLIDVREDNEWQAGHLPNAIHLSIGRIQNEILQMVDDKDSEVVLYCGSGHRSAIAAGLLQQMGYNKVYSLEGGIRAWISADLPVE